MTFSVRGVDHHHLAAEMQGAPQPLLDSGGIPGRADAEAVNLAGLEAFHHVGRGQNNNPSVVGRIDAGGCYPEPQLLGMA